ncbi:MAG: hypothetical protein NC338_00645 [Firmicutes bacterium]|nr:hypothetical protein [Bacillota bacterium]MCM1400628.1 hypothetical protein [Bacteroides sp.]MCM1477777.1 hypothetical protein [Bacteroides sp.]
MFRKKFIALATALLGSVLAISAQTLNVHLSDGSTVSYPTNQVDSLTFDAPASPAINMQVSGITASSAQITVDCADPGQTYYFDLCTKAAYDRYGGSIAAIVDEYIQQQINRYSDMLSIDQILGGLLDTGFKNEEIGGLPSDADMVAYAICVDSEGKPFGAATTVAFRTLPAGNPADCTFQIAATNVTDEGCTVNVIPSDGSINYWYGIVKKSEYPGDRAMMSAVTATFQQAAQEYGMSIQELVSRVCYRGTVSQEESGLETNQPYYIFAFALNEDGSNAGTLTKVQFTTLEFVEGDAEISISYRYFDGNALAATDAAYERYKGGVLLQVRVTPNGSAAHWTVGVGANDMTDTDVYPDDATKLALLSGMGRHDMEEMNFVVPYGTVTFAYFAADEAGIDGPLKRLKADITPEGVRPPSELSFLTTQALAARMSAPAFSIAPQKGAKSLKLQRAATHFRK